MKYLLVSLTAGLLSAGLVNASPAPVEKRAVSTDGSCGGANGYTCQGSAFGNCCSQYGWCGSSTAHCGTGCNSAFGTCTSSGSSSRPASSVVPSSTPAKSSSAPVSTPSTSTKKVSPDATCGGTAGYTCLGSSFGNCCSSSGWCGSTTAYCGSGCQSNFGNCGSNTGTGTTTAQSSGTIRSTSSPSATPSGSVLQCLNGKNVPYKMTSDADYAKLVAPYNLRLAYNPAAVVLPTTNKHVQDAVLCAGQTGIKVQAKSGGHSYASFSSGGKDGSMMIDLQSFQTVTLDKSSGIVTVGGGVRLGNLADGIWNQNKAALAHGTCPGVGIGGHSTHGGYGPVSRSWGLAMDQIVAVDVVLADGSLVKATSSQNADIYWAVRGAADSFGVITTFYMQTRAAPSSVTYFQFDFNNVFGSKATFTNTFLHMQDVARNASVTDSRVSFGVYMDNGGTWSMSGVFLGTVAEFNQKVKTELLRTMPSNTPTVQSMTWYDYLVKVSGESTIKEPLTGYDQHQTFFAKSLTVPEATPLTATALNALYDYLKTNGNIEYYVIINLYGGPGSVINQKDTSFAAYSDRDSLWVFQNWGYGANSVNFINGINNAVISAQPQTSFGAYLNYVDPTYSPATAHKLYYGDAVYSRLASLKTQYDPKGVFWNPQAVGA